MELPTAVSVKLELEYEHKHEYSDTTHNTMDDGERVQQYEFGYSTSSGSRLLTSLEAPHAIPALHDWQRHVSDSR